MLQMALLLSSMVNTASCKQPLSMIACKLVSFFITFLTTEVPVIRKRLSLASRLLFKQPHFVI